MYVCRSTYILSEHNKTARFRYKMIYIQRWLHTNTFFTSPSFLESQLKSVITYQKSNKSKANAVIKLIPERKGT